MPPTSVEAERAFSAAAASRIFSTKLHSRLSGTSTNVFSMAIYRHKLQEKA